MIEHAAKVKSFAPKIFVFRCQQKKKKKKKLLTMSTLPTNDRGFYLKETFFKFTLQSLFSGQLSRKLVWSTFTENK